MQKKVGEKIKNGNRFYMLTRDSLLVSIIGQNSCGPIKKEVKYMYDMILQEDGLFF